MKLQTLNNLAENQGYQIPIQNFCEQNGCVNSLGYNVGCCFTFNFEITLKPCIGNEIDCPLIHFTKPFSICCYCGTSGGSND